MDERLNLMQYTIKNVEALWPRINRPYKFDTVERKSMPCDPKDPAGTYELMFRMTSGQAKELFAEMTKAWNERRKTETTWPEKFTNPFKKEEDTGCWTGRAQLRASFNGELTQKPKQYSRDGQLYGDDFMLTTGSKINISTTLIPYKMPSGAYGVSVRLRGVHVIEYREMVSPNPFGDMTDLIPSHPFGNHTPEAKPMDDFGLPPVNAPAAKKPDPVDDFGDEIPF
jgi:hypothetical protein